MKTLTNTVFTGKWIVHTPHNKTHLHAFPPSSDWSSQRLRVSRLGLLQGALEQLREYLCVCVCVCVCVCMPEDTHFHGTCILRYISGIRIVCAFTKLIRVYKLLSKNVPLVDTPNNSV